MQSKPEILSVTRIWDAAGHNGLPDLIVYKEALLCCFREASSHQGDSGSIRILKSADDGETWSSVAFLSHEALDLRDPHFSITPDGTLMLTLGGSTYIDGQYRGCSPQVAFSKDGTLWSPLENIPLPQEWIWRVTWHEGVGYGFSYRLSSIEDRNREWILSLFKTEDGRSYKLVKTFDIGDHPSETTIRFTEDGTMVALLRRRGNALIGTASAPYTEWQWCDSGRCVGGPNFLILPDGTMVAAGRDYEIHADDTRGFTLGHTALGTMTLRDYVPELVLPSGGDNSYPGMVYKDGKLLICYYSSHEGKACIYFAEVLMSES